METSSSYGWRSKNSMTICALFGNQQEKIENGGTKLAPPLVANGWSVMASAGVKPSLFRRHDVHRVSALDGDAAVGLACQGGLRGRKIPLDNILYLDDQIQVTITINVLH